MIKNKAIASVNISALRNEKGNICITIIVPTHRFSAERKSDKSEINRAVENAKQLLNDKYPAAETKALQRRMDELFNSLNWTHGRVGLGLYISPAIHLAVPFSFPVQEKVMVSDHFELRELLYAENYADPYFVLLLTEHGGQLYNGTGDTLFEVKDKHFPSRHRDDYEYAKPVRSSSYAGHAHVKTFEKDKTELETTRSRDFLRKIDKSLHTLLVDDTPLVVLGVRKELALFNEISKHRRNIIGSIPGNYSHNNEKELADIAWPVVRSHWENKRQDLVKEFEERIGEKRGVSGLQDVWAAAHEGKALQLLVEKDYRRPAYLGENEFHLYLHAPQTPHRVLADAVDELIETVLDKNGQVYFVENDILKDHQRIALITRY